MLTGKKGKLMRKLSRYCQIILLTLIAQGCANSSLKTAAIESDPDVTAPAINTTLFSNGKNDVVDENEIFYLSDKQKNEFLTFYRRQLSIGVKPHKALSNFLDNRLNNFVYYGETYVAEQAMRLDKGNCMSLAILTTALANVVNLEVDYREVNSLPIFEKFENIVLSSSHVQAVIYDPTFVEDKGYIYWRKPAVIIDYFPVKTNRVSTKILKESLLAMYYINIASTALVDNDLNTAFANAQRAYKYNKNSPQVISLLGVLHRRAGDEKTSENFYRYGIDLNIDNLSLLTNYSVLLREQHRMKEFQKINDKIDTLFDPNPYTWLEQAFFAQRENNNRKAEKYFLKVIEMAPYVQQAYLGLYQVYSKLDKKNTARRILKDALKWAHEDDDRLLYKQKIYSLSH